LPYTVNGFIVGILQKHVNGFIAMSSLKGGRGKALPWKTTHVRCPEPISDEVRRIIDIWKAEQLEVDSTQKTTLKTSDEVSEIVRKILRSKKSARVSIERLLTELGYEVNLD
jgi:hypothetical protein